MKNLLLGLFLLIGLSAQSALYYFTWADTNSSDVVTNIAKSLAVSASLWKTNAAEGTITNINTTGARIYGPLISTNGTTYIGEIIGVIDASSATAGYLGEVVSSAIASGSATSLTTATAKNVTSISLTAGDWDVSGNVNFSAASATVTGASGGISTTSATVPTDGTEVFSGVQVTLLSETDSVTLPRKVVNVSSTTTVYLVGKSTFSAGTVSAFGSITARRIR